MNIKFSKKINKLSHKKDGRFDPHYFWSHFVVIFIILFTLLIIGLSYFFIITSKSLDKEVEPKIDKNIEQINKIEKSIKTAEEAILNRKPISE